MYALPFKCSFQLRADARPRTGEGADTKGLQCRLGMQAPGPWGGTPGWDMREASCRREDLISLDLVGARDSRRQEGE